MLSPRRRLTPRASSPDGVGDGAGARRAVAFGLTLVALALVVGLTAAVLAGHTGRLDAAALHWMDARSSPWLDRAAVAVTTVGNFGVLAAISVAAGAGLHRRRAGRYAALPLASLAGAATLNPTLKAVFGRPRPDVFEGAVRETGLSFPSGHATMTMAVFLAVGYAAYRCGTRGRAAVAVASLAGATVLLVGLSRVYLGVHYPSDVLAGFGVGFVWATWCALGVETLSRRRRAGRPARASRASARSPTTSSPGGRQA